MDPNVVLTWLNNGLILLSNGLTVAVQILSLAAPFL